jgi:hypothetical protein
MLGIIGQTSGPRAILGVVLVQLGKCRHRQSPDKFGLLRSACGRSVGGDPFFSLPHRRAVPLSRIEAVPGLVRFRQRFVRGANDGPLAPLHCWWLTNRRNIPTAINSATEYRQQTTEPGAEAQWASNQRLSAPLRCLTRREGCPSPGSQVQSPEGTGSRWLLSTAASPWPAMLPLAASQTWRPTLAGWPWEPPAASQSWGLSYQPVLKAVPSPCLIWPRVIECDAQCSAKSCGRE